MSKAILFSRVSTDAQNLDTQEHVLLDAAKKDGYTEDDLIIISESESGIKKSIKERIGISKAKQVIETQDVNAIYCFELSRIARRLDVFAEFRKYLIDKKIQLKILNPAVNLLDENGEVDDNFSLVFSIFASLAESEARLLKQRTTRGRLHKAKQNKFIGGSIYFGYKRDKNDNFIIDENQASVIRRIFDEYIENNKSMRQIGVDLILDGTISMTVSSARCYVQRILHSDCYCGNPVEFKGYTRTYPAIISKDTFEEACKKSGYNQHVQKKTSKHQYLCRGLVFSASGKPFIAVKSTNTFNCLINDQPGNRELLAVNIDALDNVVKYNLRNYLLDLPKKDLLQEQYELLDKAEILSKGILTLEKSISDKDSQLDRLEARIVLGKITDITAEKLEKEIERERNILKDTLIKKQEELKSVNDKISKLKSGKIEVYTEQELDELSFEELRELVSKYIQRIVVNKITRNKRLITIFNNMADDCKIYHLNCYTKKFEEIKIEYH